MQHRIPVLTLVSLAVSLAVGAAALAPLADLPLDTVEPTPVPFDDEGGA